LRRLAVKDFSPAGGRWSDIYHVMQRPIMEALKANGVSEKLV